LLPVLLLSGALMALGCGGGDDDPEAVCGNGVIEAEEQCDGVNLNEQTCVTKGFDGGTLSCTATCQFDTSGCTDAPADCGNGVVDAGEQCDGANLNEQTCETQGFDGGTLSCTAICQFDTTGCTRIEPDCGNGVVDAGEQCDGANLNEQTCETQGFDGGTLSCTAICQFDTTGCTKIGPDCGNGEIDEGEQCDGTNLNEQTCETQGFDGGTLSCTAACQFDTTGCTKIGPDCGNGEIDEGEQCDGTNLNSQSCETQGFDGGTLSCTEDCQFDTTGCTTITKVGVGEPCTRDIECESDLCLTEVLHGFPSGYCVAPCNEDASCDDANAICVDVGPQHLCIRSCAPGGSDCRNAYNCADLGEGAGACWPACTEHSQCSTAGHCNERGFCEVSCTEDSDCPAGLACGSEGLCELIDDCVTQGCNDPEGSLYCHEASGYCFEDACLDNPCDGLANASGECERYFDEYRCVCNEGYIWDDDADACIAFECSAIDLGTFNGTRIEQTGDTCDGTSLYNAGGNGVSSCTRYTSEDKELVYKLTVPAGGAVKVHMEPTDFDASLWVTTSCDDVLGLKCVVGADDPETLVIDNDTTEDQTYYIIADAYENCGEFTLTVSGLSYCGNGEIDAGEQCDGANLNSQSCESQGFDGGTLGCTEDCQFDTSSCTTITKVGVGEPCTSNAECESGFCLTEIDYGFPSGYCAAPCNEDASCDDANAICAYVGEHLCIRSCAPGGSDCRDAYNCQVLSEGVGACWPACTENRQCPDTGTCNERGFCEVSCTEDSDCPAGMACGSEGVCEVIWDCGSRGCNDPEGKLYCHEVSGRCYEDLCLDNPCDGLANASGECQRYFDDYRCVCNKDYVWDGDAYACIAFECSAIDLGTFDGTLIEQTGDTCYGTSFYNAGGSGTWSCTGYTSKAKELVYKLTVPAGEAVEVRMETTDFDASLWVTTSCDDFLGLGCIVGADDPETLVIDNDTTEDQTYYIIADAYENCGEFTLSVSKPPRCGNGIVDGNDQCDGDDLDEQTCEGLGYFGGGTLGCTEDCKFNTSECIFGCQAVDLGTFSETITRSNQNTCSAGSSRYNAGGTGDSCTRYSTNGNEIVYELTVQAGETVLVVVDHTGFDAAIWVTPSCDDMLGAQCIVGVDRSSSTSGREELDFINDGDSPKTYYIVVDAYSGCGTFDLTISSLGKCGNGVKEGLEECDGLDLEGASCSNFGFIEGTLTCNAQCKLDFTDCNYGSLQPVGGPCTTDADCASGICWDELNMGLPGGYCVDECREEGGCWDPANICVSYKDDSLCVKKCSPGESGGCRDGYECLALSEGNGACWPKCTADSQCSVVGRCDLDSGFCSCPLGQHVEAGACVYDDCEYLGCANLNRNCDPTGGCSGACAVCTDCVPGTEPSSGDRCQLIGAAWGGPCEVDADCPGSGTPGEDTYCDKSSTGGFCIQLGGPDYVADGQPCTGDPNSVGVSFMHWLIPTCLQGCTTDADCRMGYACSTVMDYNGAVLACSPIKDCDTYGCNHDGSLRCAFDGQCWLYGCIPNPCTDVPHSTQTCVNFRDSHMCECVDDHRWDDDSMSCVSFECTAQDLGTVDRQIQLMGEDSCTGTSEYHAGGTGVSCTNFGTMSKEKVYKVTLPAGVSVYIEMVPVVDFDASLWVTTACNDFNGVKCVKGADNSSPGQPEAVTITNEGSEPATYYIVADAYSGCGNFNLTITPQ